MASEFYLWEGIGIDHESLKNAYSNNNYKVIDTESDSDKCLICFSGNGLYFPNTLESFESAIIDRDRYEWANLIKSERIQKYYQRIILIRDIYKQWYVTGINERCNNPEKLLAELNVLTTHEGKKMEVSVVGNSAGGYAAVLYGTLLEADRIFNFSGQYNLNDEIYRGDKLVAPFLEKYKGAAGRYYDLKPIIERANDAPHYYYFFPYRCEWDRREYEYVASIKAIKPFFFASKYHGTTVWGGG